MILQKFFNISVLVALPPSQYYVNFLLSVLCLIILQLANLYFGGYGVFSVYINNIDILLACVRSW